MRRYILSPRAGADMDALVEFYGDTHPDYGVRLVRDLVAQFKLLARFPGLGKPANELLPGLRMSRVRDVIIYFRRLASGAEIVRVIHGARHITTDDFRS